MKTIIELPRAFEARSVKYDKEKNQVVIEHRFIQSQSIVLVGYFNCEGKNGNASRSAVMLHGNTGRYSVQEFGDEKTMAFDLSLEEYAEVVKRRKTSFQKGRQKRSREKATANSGSEFRE